MYTHATQMITHSYVTCMEDLYRNIQHLYLYDSVHQTWRLAEADIKKEPTSEHTIILVI